MNKRVDTIMDEARKLTPEERDDLLMRLHLEFEDGEPDGTPEEKEAALVEEVQRRIGMAERGETIGVPSDVVHARIRELLRRQ